MEQRSARLAELRTALLDSYDFTDAAKMGSAEWGMTRRDRP